MIWGISPSVTIAGNGEVVFSSVTFNDTATPASVQVGGTGGVVFSDCTFQNATANPVMNATGGNLTVTGCQFRKPLIQQTDAHVSLSAAVAKAVVVGNVATPTGVPFRVLPPSPPPNVVVANNV